MAIVAVISWILGVSTPAHAQDGREQARELFQEGVAASGDEDWETAASRFEEALALHSAPSIEYNLASAYVELGRLGEAGDLTAAVLANPDTPPEIDEHVRELDEQIAERAGTLIVRVSGEGSTGAAVYVDGRELSESRVGVPRHETPGAREVSVSRADGATEERTLTVTAGETTTADFSSQVLVGEGGSQGTGARSGALTSPIFWSILGGAVGIFIIAAIVLAASAPSSTPAAAMMPLTSF